jgi:hypothetical protein
MSYGRVSAAFIVLLPFAATGATFLLLAGGASIQASIRSRRETTLTRARTKILIYLTGTSTGIARAACGRRGAPGTKNVATKPRAIGGADVAG